MATVQELRTSLRVRLEDAGAGPLFSDDELNDLLGLALAEYGRTVPLAALATATVAVGVTDFPLPAGVMAAGLVRVRDARGATVPVMAEQFGQAAADMVSAQQAWRVWADTVVLQRAVAGSEAGTWSLEHLAARELPGSDAGVMPIEPGDEPLVIELTLARVYERRSFEDYKRGAGGEVGRELAAQVRETAAAMWKRRNRRARSGFLDAV